MNLYVVIPIIAMLTFIMLVVLLSGANSHNRSLADHYLHGWFRVLYPDGQVSQPFTFWTAWSYRKLFGGRIILRDSKAARARLNRPRKR
jgi:hypothetical protein